MNSSWATQDPPGLLWFEQAENAGAYLAAIFYGAHVVIFFMCGYYIIQGKTKESKLWIAWLVYIFSLFALGTINLCMNIRFNELAWIDERNYPGGPLAFLLEQESIPVNTLGDAAGLVADFLADSLLVYRVYVLWRKWYIVVLPIAMLMANTVLSCLTTVQAALPGASLWTQNTLNFSVPYWSMSMALNIVLTIFLVVRVLWMRRKITQALGPQYSNTYTGVAAMVVESALPYALVSFVFVVLYGLQNTAENLFIPVITQVECISPMLVILRVARGRALSDKTVSDAILVSMRVSGKNDSETIAQDTSSKMTLKPGSMNSIQVYRSMDVSTGVDSVV